MNYLLSLFLSEDHLSNQRFRALIFAFDLPGSFFCSVHYCWLYLTYRAIKTCVVVPPMPIWCTITKSIIWGRIYFTCVICSLFAWILLLNSIQYFSICPISSKFTKPTSFKTLLTSLISHIFLIIWHSTPHFLASSAAVNSHVLQQYTKTGLKEQQNWSTFSKTSVCLLNSDFSSTKTLWPRYVLQKHPNRILDSPA